MKLMSLLGGLWRLLLLTCLLSVGQPAFAAITIDGSASDWTETDRLDTATDLAVSGYKLYGRHESGTYKFLLQSDSQVIGENTTIWLDTDQNTATGYQVFGFAGGADYNINFYSDGKPYLYSGAAAENYVTGPLTYATTTSGTGSIMEFEVPESLIGSPTGAGINLLLDVNDTTFLPSDYSVTARYTIARSTTGNSTPTVGTLATDWTDAERIDVSSNLTVADYKLYGRYTNNTYKIRLESTSRVIGTGSTVWLNTDNNVSTGYSIFGFAGGEEYNVNFYTDGKPYLYTSAAGETYVTGPLTYASAPNGASGSVVEIEIPENLIGTPSGTAIQLLLDVNNTDYLPTYYSASTAYSLPRNTTTTTSTDRRLGIVYSATSAARFWDMKNYSQLFMSAQAQAMMAGIPYDLLSETDLTDLTKLKKYSALVFPYFQYVPAASLSTIETNLTQASTQYKIGIIAAGDFMTNDAAGNALSGDPYSRMKNLLGIARVNGAGPTTVTLKAASTVTHPVLKDEYTANETLLSYTNAYTDYFAASGSSAVTTLATQTVGTATQNAVLASEIGGRNVHFGTVSIMGDSNMLWSAMRWSVYGSTPLAGLQLGRNKAIFASRNDTDMAMYASTFSTVENALVTLLQQWKTNYNFVGSYYIDVGNNQASGQYTDWTVAKPVYQQFMNLGNEIGTHSYTHPFDTNTLTAAQLQTEFADSRSVIEQNLGLSNIGGAVPGAPDNFTTAQGIIQHVNYLTGGYSGSGAGFPNAFGYLTPSDTKVYLSPNMTFDYTNIEYLKLTAAQTEAKWATEFDTLTKHAKRAIIHWPWHDYGPTSPGLAKGYTVAMFDNLIKKASTFGAEFITGDDLRQRIDAFHSATLSVTQPDSTTVTATVQSSNAGRFAIDIPQATGTTKIKSVDSWYAYNDKQVFVDKDGGTFTARLGTAADSVTHITALPARANLTALTGDGTDLNFTLTGEGSMTVATKCTTAPTVTGASSSSFSSQVLTLKFTSSNTYTVKVDCP